MDAGVFSAVRIGRMNGAMRRISPAQQIARYRLTDALLTARATLSAMLCSAREVGSHGGAVVIGKAHPVPDTPRATRTLTRGEDSRIEPVTPLPDPELWFETLLARQKNITKE